MFANFEKKYNIKYVLQDSILISYPKSGRTWLRMIMAKLINIKGLDTSKKEFMPAVHYDVEKLRSMFGTELKVIFLHRNVADVVSSYYAEKSTSNRSGALYRGSVREFMRDKQYGVDAAIIFNKQWLEWASINTSIKVVSYEDLIKDTVSEISEIMGFLGFHCLDGEVMEAVEYSKFDNMSKIEKGIGDNLLSGYKGNFGKSIGRVRRGKVGGYREDFSEEDINYIEKRKRALAYDT